MKLRSPKAIRFALAIVGLTSLVLILVLHEPSYDGHRLSYWVDRVDGPGADQERAKEAIREIGPKAIPFLFKKSRSIEAQRRRGSVWFKLSPDLQSFFGPDPSIRELEQAPDEKEYRTRLQVLDALGPAAQPAVPAMLRVMTHFSTDLSHPVREALRKIDPEAAAKLDPLQKP